VAARLGHDREIYQTLASRPALRDDAPVRRRWIHGAIALALCAGAGCTTLSTPVTNENYGARPAGARRARSDSAMDHVVRGEDPCADTVERPRPRRRRDDSGCEMSSAPGMLRVEVRGDQAFQVGTLSDTEVASIDEDGTVWEHTLLGEEHEAGEVRCRKLVLHRLLEDSVAARVDDDAVVTIGMFHARYDRPAGCDDEQAALGAFALMLLHQRTSNAMSDDKPFDVVPKRRPAPGLPPRPGRP
jgi:hypothetical protein